MISLSELINKIIRRFNLLYHNFLFKTISNIEFLYLRSIGVNIKKGCQFNGWTSVFKCDHSQISIGNHCIFNSNQYTNHIGINHNCILTTISSKASLYIGNQCGFSGCSITAFTSIEIGNNVRVGANCVIADGDFHLDDSRTPSPKPIKIHDNVWLGYGVIVMKGVTIGENTIIGMNSIVTKDIPANCIAAGNPCKVIKEIKI